MNNYYTVVSSSPGQSAVFPGTQSALLLLRGNEVRTLGRTSRTSRQENWQDWESGAMMGVKARDGGVEKETDEMDGGVDVNTKRLKRGTETER